MKRDMDLARQIMLELEQAQYTGAWIHISIENFSKEKVNYHVMLLAKANLIEAEKYVNSCGTERLPISLNMQGHDFLEAAKNETIWQKAKTHIQNKGGVLTFDVAKAVLAQASLKQVGL